MSATALEHIAGDDKPHNISLQCDRCKQIVRGQYMAGRLGFTSGFYDTSGTAWGKYAAPGEEILCDDCMHHDPRYIADYYPPFDF